MVSRGPAKLSTPLGSLGLVPVLRNGFGFGSGSNIFGFRFGFGSAKEPGFWVRFRFGSKHCFWLSFLLNLKRIQENRHSIVIISKFLTFLATNLLVRVAGESLASSVEESESERCEQCALGLQKLAPNRQLAR
jgi:hypothetical protein